MLEETERTLVYVDIDGVKRQFTKDNGRLPTALDNPIQDRATWNRLKSERLSLKNVKGRFPPNWPELLREVQEPRLSPGARRVSPGVLRHARAPHGVREAVLQLHR